MEKAEVAGIGRRSQTRLVSEVEAHGEEAVIKLAIATEFEMVVQTDVRKSVGEEFRKRFAMGGHLRKGPSRQCCCFRERNSTCHVGESARRKRINF